MTRARLLKVLKDESDETRKKAAWALALALAAPASLSLIEGAHPRESSACRRRTAAGDRGGGKLHLARGV